MSSAIFSLSFFSRELECRRDFFLFASVELKGEKKRKKHSVSLFASLPIKIRPRGNETRGRHGKEKSFKKSKLPSS